jgi:hypothetical protein
MHSRKAVSDPGENAHNIASREGLISVDNMSQWASVGYKFEYHATYWNIYTAEDQ